jgi:uncharacterized membrane protein YgaE (UPF0421/DUF939 family)
MPHSRATQALGLARRRLLERLWPIVQTAAAAVAAWYFARFALGVHLPLFAPIAAVIALGATHGQQGRRVVELVGGVVLGISAADLIVHAIGAGPWQAGVMIILAMGTAVALGGGELLVSEAGVSAILIVTLTPTEGLSPDRFLEAVIGGGVALVVAILLFPADPAMRVTRALNVVLGELGGVLAELARSLEAADAGAAQRSQEHARSIDDHLARVRAELADQRETTRYAPPRRRARGTIAAIERSLPEIGYALGDTRVLARTAHRHLRAGRDAPPELVAAVRALAEGVWELASGFDRDEREPAVRDALADTAQLTRLAEEARDVGLAELSAPVRSVAVDLVRAADLATAGGVPGDSPTEELLAS